MRPPLLERIKARLCRWFGHRTEDDGYVVSCRRCLHVLAASPVRDGSDDDSESCHIGRGWCMKCVRTPR